MEDKKLFRDQAMETVSNPEQLDQHIKVTRPFSWVILTAIVALVIGVGIWAFTGNVSSGTDIKGVIFSSEGIIVANALNSGTVVDVLVQGGDMVEKGDTLVVIPDEELLQRIKIKKAEYDAASGSAKESIKTTLNSLRYQYIMNSFISATKAGTINSVPAVGEAITEGDQVAVNFSEATMSGATEIIAYVPYSIASGFKVGAEVQISPSNAPREEYGYMFGKITNVGTTIVTEESIIRTMGSTKYVSSLDIEPNSIEVRIRPNVDSSTKSGFEWSNSKGGQNVTIEMGMTCNIKVVTREVRPINLVM